MAAFPHFRRSAYSRARRRRTRPLPAVHLSARRPHVVGVRKWGRGKGRQRGGGTLWAIRRSMKSGRARPRGEGRWYSRRRGILRVRRLNNAKRSSLLCVRILRTRRNVAAEIKEPTKEGGDGGGLLSLSVFSRESERAWAGLARASPLSSVSAVDGDSLGSPSSENRGKREETSAYAVELATFH